MSSEFKALANPHSCYEHYQNHLKHKLGKKIQEAAFTCKRQHKMRLPVAHYSKTAFQNSF